MAGKNRKDRKTIIRIVVMVVLLFLAAAAFKIYEDIFAGNIARETGREFLYYRTDYTFEENFAALEKEGILRNPDALKRLIRIFGFEDMLRPGRYRVDESTSNLDLIRMLASGRQEPLDITFRYAERKTDLAAFWGKQLEADSVKVLELLNTPSTLDSMGLDTTQSILLFIPNTYNFYWNTSAEKLVQRMKTEYVLFWDTTRSRLAEALGLSPAEVGILASIVQKETAKKDEMPLIAGVYYNRLKRSMPLQADPTIIYAMNDRSIRRVRGPMLDVASPYNTYRNKGLPPGPICVPSVQAVDAVLHMPKHDYLYFCANWDFSGYHCFAPSFSQHMRNARKYQQELNRRAIR